MTLRERIARARSIWVLTGSGISAESGMPTFRGAGGSQGFARDPELVEIYPERRNELLLADNLHPTRALAKHDPTLGRTVPTSLDVMRSRSKRGAEAR